MSKRTDAPGGTGGEEGRREPAALARTQSARAAPAGLTEARENAVLAQLRESGRYDEAAAAAGVSYMTLYRWRKADAAFAERCTAAIDAMNVRIGQKYRRAAELHVDSVIAGERLPDKYAVVQKTGETVLVQRGERIPLNTQLARYALTKLDPSWTAPKQEVEHTGAVTLTEAVAAAHQALEDEAAPASAPAQEPKAAPSVH